MHRLMSGSEHFCNHPIQGERIVRSAGLTSACKLFVGLGGGEPAALRNWKTVRIVGASLRAMSAMSYWKEQIRSVIFRFVA